MLNVVVRPGSRKLRTEGDNADDKAALQAAGRLFTNDKGETRVKTDRIVSVANRDDGTATSAPLTSVMRGALSGMKAGVHFGDPAIASALAKHLAEAQAMAPEWVREATQEHGAHIENADAILAIGSKKASKKAKSKDKPLHNKVKEEAAA